MELTEEELREETVIKPSEVKRTIYVKPFSKMNPQEGVISEKVYTQEDKFNYLINQMSEGNRLKFKNLHGNSRDGVRSLFNAYHTWPFPEYQVVLSEGKDHTIISRTLTKLENAGVIHKNKRGWVTRVEGLDDKTVLEMIVNKYDVWHKRPQKGTKQTPKPKALLEKVTVPVVLSPPVEAPVVTAGACDTSFIETIMKDWKFRYEMLREIFPAVPEAELRMTFLRMVSVDLKVG